MKIASNYQKIPSTTFQRKKRSPAVIRRRELPRNPNATKSAQPNLRLQIFVGVMTKVFLLGVLKGCWAETPSFYYSLAIGVLFLKR